MTTTSRWNIAVKTPMGTQESVLELSVDGSTLTGQLTDKGGEPVALSDGRAEGDSLSWTAKVQKPMPMSLQFNVVVAGDAISGGVKTPFGTAPLTGTKA